MKETALMNEMVVRMRDKGHKEHSPRSITTQDGLKRSVNGGEVHDCPQKLTIGIWFTRGGDASNRSFDPLEESFAGLKKHRVPEHPADILSA